MFDSIVRPFVRLVATSPEIERLPFIQRPRTMAATWGGLLVCKGAAMVLISPSLGAQAFAVTLAIGIVATFAKFGSDDVETPSGDSVFSPA